MLPKQPLNRFMKYGKKPFRKSIQAFDQQGVFLANAEQIASISSATAILEAVTKQSRKTKWELIRQVPLDFPTHHPQGLAFAGDYLFLSSVEVLEAPTNVFDPTRSTPGRGVGHMFVLDGKGELVRDITIGEGDMYHPGGIDFDGSNVWVPMGEYRPGANSMVLTVDPVTFAVSERFRVKDSIGWAISDRDTGTIYGGNWGSRRFYTWGEDGEERDRWENPSSFIDYQDCQFAKNGQAVCSGIAVLPQANGTGEYELGGVAIIDFINHRIVHETPLQIFSGAGHVLTRNPFAFTIDGEDLLLHVAPDDGFDVGGTQLLTFRASITSGVLSALPLPHAQ